jgi:antirestriction protein ArdC
MQPQTQPAASKPSREKLDVHSAVTEKIIAAIEAGAGEFQMPWHKPAQSFSTPHNALTTKRYRGSNILSLWIDADAKSFPSATWATFKQWQELGAQVRKGEKGSLIVKYGKWSPKADKGNSDKPEGTDEKGSERLYASPAWVFNAAQVDGYQPPETAPLADLTTRLAHVDAFVMATGADIRHGGHRAFYRRASGPAGAGEGDYIQMPDRHLFRGSDTSTPTEAYESTRLHELAHWTGAKHRLDREKANRFGDQAYAFEELVAELSAAFLCADLNITNTPRADHAQYIANWLQVLKNDTKAVFTAASLASKAADYLAGEQS